MLADDSPSQAEVLAAARARAAERGRPVLVSHGRPTRAQDPIDLFEQARGASSRALWLKPSTGDALVASGTAHAVCASGARRFDDVRSAWRQLLADALLDTDAPLGGPLLLGGFSFDPSRQPTRLWTGFPDARLTLFTRQVHLHDGVAWMTTNRLVKPRGVGPSLSLPERAPASDERSLSAAQWRGLVGQVAREIGVGGQVGLRKVVLARSHAGPPRRSIEAALRTLAAEYPTCTVFAFASGDACFLGATPERLISLRGGTATTMALAGSAPRGSTPEEDAALARRLLGDSKEATEHRVVVSALRASLAEVCTRVVADAQPSVHTLPNVQHLLTPIRARVASGRGILDLVECLHPTPAVGGFPRAAALELIRQRERLDRGWYAGPMGWVNARGEGEFVVGLRSALVRPGVATLFAGCGIVADSDPATESAEWGWKLRPMLRALAVEA